MNELQVIRLPLSIPSAGDALPSSDFSTTLPMPPEAAAQGHWDFNTDADSLVDLVNGLTLVPASTVPTYDSKSLTTAAGIGKGPASNIADAASKTHWGVFRWDTPSTFRIISGTADNAASKGDILHIFVSGGIHTLRALVYGLTTSTFTISKPAGVTLNTTYCFGAMVTRNTSADIYLGDKAAQTVHKATSSGGAKTVSGTRTYTVGNGYYVGNAETTNLAEFGVVDAALTDAEVEAIYLNSIMRMAEKGIDLF